MLTLELSDADASKLLQALSEQIEARVFLANNIKRQYHAQNPKPGAGSPADDQQSTGGPA